MNRNPARPLWIAGLFIGVPLLLGAQGRGCQGAHAPSMPVSPTTDAGSGACVSQPGEHCGGNTAHPCTCAAGLTCTPGSSGLPFGDVGGTCRGPSGGAAGSPSGGAAGSTSPVPDAGSAAGGAASPAPDAGSVCISNQGGHCGGNTTHPCTCTAGLVCTPGSGGAPFGDVGGTCQPPAAVDAGATDASGACVSAEGGHCGGNTTRPCTCGSGLMCVLALGGPAPGDVGGTCKRPTDAGHAADAGGPCVSNEGEVCGGNAAPPRCTCAPGLTCTGAPGGPPVGDVGGTCKHASGAGSCMHDADCHLEADYCTGCDCVALGKGEHVRPCPGPGVSCFADPCAIKSVACESGACVAH